VHTPIRPERQHTSGFGRTTSFDATIVRIDTRCGLGGWAEAEAQVGSTAADQALTAMIEIPDRPGLGITVREDFLAEHTVR